MEGAWLSGKEMRTRNRKIHDLEIHREEGKGRIRTGRIQNDYENSAFL